MTVGGAVVGDRVLAMGNVGFGEGEAVTGFCEGFAVGLRVSNGREGFIVGNEGSRCNNLQCERLRRE